MKLIQPQFVKNPYQLNNGASYFIGGDNQKVTIAADFLPFNQYTNEVNRVEKHFHK